MGWATVWLALSLATASGCNGCPGQAQCDRPSLHVSTRVVVTHVTVGSGLSQRLFEVSASGFHPNAKANLNITSFPKVDGNILAQVTMDAAGSLRWTRDAPLLLTTDPHFEPDAVVTTTVAEVATTCLGIGTSKQREFTQL